MSGKEICNKNDDKKTDELIFSINVSIEQSASFKGQASSVTIIHDNSIKIGDNNIIRKSLIGKMEAEKTTTNKQPFHQRHPWITAIVASLIAGFILLFSFWGRIIAFFERVF